MSLFPGLNDSQASALVDTATAIRTEPQWLYEQIRTESHHNPVIVNRTKAKDGIYSGAVGLIQFMPATLRGLGLIPQSMPIKTNEDKEKVIALFISKYSNYEDQMRGPVRQYYISLGPPFKSRQDLFMATFMPVARKVPPDTTFRQIYASNPINLGLPRYEKYFKAQNPNMLTVQNYLDLVAKVNKTVVRSPLPTTPKAAGGIGLGLLMLFAGVFYLLRRNV